MRLKKTWIWITLALTMCVVCGCAIPLKMDPPPSPDLSQLKPYHRTAALYFPKELKSYEYVLATSPVDQMSYPLGDQTTQLFQACSRTLFDKVVTVDSMTPAEPVDIILKPSIIKFDATVPMPAYNPYTAEMIYRMDVFNVSGEKLFTQTAAGAGQTSKGLMSGFSARTICAEVAQMAMTDAAKQIMEGLVEAEELKHLR
jgi:hypothetical protein